MNLSPTDSTNQKRSIWIFFGLLLSAGVSYIVLLWQYGDAAFGYDTGIYRRIALDHIAAPSLADVPPFAFGTIARILSYVGLSIDGILVALYVGIGLTIPVLLYVMTRRYSATAALLVMFLYVTSITQFDFFTWYYYRNLIAIACFLVSVLLLQKKSWFLSIPLFLLVSIHPLSALPVYITLGIYGLYTSSHRTYLFLNFFISGGTALFLNWPEFSRYMAILFSYDGLIRNVPAMLAQELDGQFTTFQSYIFNSLLYLPFGIYGLYKYGKQHLLWSILFVITTICILAQTLLYKRYYIWIDLSLLFFAGITLSHIMQHLTPERWRHAALLLYATCALLPALHARYIYIPQITQTQILEMQTLAKRIPQGSTLVSITSSDAPWLLGFASDHTIIAPGVFDANKWNYSEWQQFWSTTDIATRRTLFERYDEKEFYIYTGPRSLHTLFMGDAHMEPLTPLMWKYSKE